MAMTKCKDCGGDMSKNAKACPKCGKVLPMKIGIVPALIVIAVVGGGIYWWHSQQWNEMQKEPVFVERQTFNAEMEASRKQREEERQQEISEYLRKQEATRAADQK